MDIKNFFIGDFDENDDGRCLVIVFCKGGSDTTIQEFIELIKQEYEISYGYEFGPTTEILLMTSEKFFARLRRNRIY
jgi:hypothetical protein